MFETIAAIHGGYEIEPATNPRAVALYQSGTSLFETADRAVGLFNLELQRHRSSRTCDPTTANLERNGRRAEASHFCSAADNNEAGTCSQSTACEARQ